MPKNGRAFLPPDLDAFAASLHQETDRACAVLGAALLDSTLEDLVRARLKTRREDLLGSNRPLGSFSSRISLAHALSWIDDDAAADLDLIRSVRNDFAHAFDHALDFNRQPIADRCTKLVTACSYLDGVSASAAHNPNFSTAIFASMRVEFSTPRWRFQLAVGFLYQLLRDLPRPVSAYHGPSIRAEVFDLAARARFRVQGTGSGAPPPAKATQSRDAEDDAQGGADRHR
jgi:hypothetical protein